MDFTEILLHGTVIVISQEDDDLAESIAGPLKIPDKAGCSRINIKYYEEPIVKMVDFTVQNYFQRIDGILDDYKFRDTAWALTNYLANDINDMNTSNAGIESDSQDLDETRVSNEVRTSANFDALMENSQIDDNLNDCSNEGENSILSISTEHQSKSKINKSKVMPTWAATNIVISLQSYSYTVLISLGRFVGQYF